MNIKLVGAYVGAVFSGLVVLLAALLVILQWANTSKFLLFGKDTFPNSALLILGCVAFGALLPWLLKLLLHCAVTIAQRQRQSAALGKAAAKAVTKQSTPTNQE